MRSAPEPFSRLAVENVGSVDENAISQIKTEISEEHCKQKVQYDRLPWVRVSQSDFNFCAIFVSVHKVNDLGSWSRRTERSFRILNNGTPPTRLFVTKLSQGL